MPKRPPGQPRGDQRWSLLRGCHCDVPDALRVCCHRARDAPTGACKCVTAHPSAEWTLQQLREVIGEEGGRQYLIHDRDKIFAKHLDDSIRALGIEVLRSPVASPKANAVCERVIGTIRRECLDWMIPLSAAHLRSILKLWVEHYNHGRPHTSLGPGVPDPPEILVMVRKLESRHRLGEGVVVLAESVLGGLHHEYSRAPSVA